MPHIELRTGLLYLIVGTRSVPKLSEGRRHEDMASRGSDIAADFVMVNGLRSYEVSFEQTFAWPFHLSPEVIVLENRDRSECRIVVVREVEKHAGLLPRRPHFGLLM